MRWNDLSNPKLQRCSRLGLEMDKIFHPTLYWAYDYLSMVGLKLIHINKRHTGDAIALLLYRQYNVLFSWWRHQIETFSALLVLCVGIHQSPVDSPHKGQWRGALMFSSLEQTVEQTMETPVIWDANALIVKSLCNMFPHIISAGKGFAECSFIKV